MFRFFRREPSARAAEKLVARGKIEAAIRMYRRVLRGNPGDSSTLNRVGDLLARVDKYGEAIDLYRQTAELFVEQGFYVKAIAVYKKIHRLDPSQLDVYRKLADLYTLQGLHNDARTHYQVLIDYHDRQGDLAAAIGVCRKLVEIQPQDPTHRTRLAELYERSGDTAAVAREYLEIARVMLQRGALEKATQVLERALLVNGGDADFLVGAVGLLRAEQHHDFAETFLAEAEEIHQRAGRAGLVEEVRARLEPAEAAAPAAADSPPSPSGPPARGSAILAESDLSLDLDEDVYVLQPLDQEPEALPPSPSRSAAAPDDALGEIEVFIKYGFREKALNRLGELLREEPANLRAHGMLIELMLQDGSHRAAVEAANQMAAIAAQSGQEDDWRETRDRLRAAGFLVGSDGVEAPPASLGADTDEFDLLETGLTGASAPASPSRETPPGPGDLFELLPSELEQPAPTVPSSPGREQEQVDFVVVDDGEFADLAAEVELEMETAGGLPTTEGDAPSVEEIVASFKQGVAENLSPEDYDTHYNLGIAYREMGLIDEAVGEFEIAVQSRDYRIGCCSLLGLCFRDKGEMDAAMQWLQRGLETPDLLEHERHALLYE
ncbi:MAG TPA: tetratricopeptide repeat protein, partial [Thermoanaerobaculia bacterium]|nr:tetratricopeptide repeat protein [Thermoanaerobaculia bacterium]